MSRRGTSARVLAVIVAVATVGLAAAACGSAGSPGPGSGPPVSPGPGSAAPGSALPASPAPPASADVTAGPATAVPATPGHSPGAIELTVFAAASLREAFGAVKRSYEAANAGVTLTFSFDASSALRAQIEQGAPVDLFASADTKNPQALADAGLATDQPQPFAGNRLALVVPAANPAGISSPVDLARPGVRVVSAGPEVPITAYAAELLGNLARMPGYSAGFVAAVAANVVSREDNVKVVLAKVQLGEGDAGIVYATDATAAGDAVRVIPIPAAANVLVAYAAVVPKDAPNPAAAAAFLAWLGSPDGLAVLVPFGFIAPAS